VFAVIAFLCCGAWCAAAEPWLRLTTAHFELYTTAGEEVGRSLILSLERLRTSLQPVVEQRDERQKTVCIIAFGSRDEFQRYAPMSRSTGFFLPGAGRDFIVLDGPSGESRTAAHEYAHLVMSRGGFHLPAWLNEGLAELYSNLADGRMGRFIPSRVLSLHRDGWIGLAELVSKSEVLTSPGSVDSAYAESWLLAHMLVLDPRYAGEFPGLLAALQNSGTAEAFGQVYGESIAQVERDLKAYLEVGAANVRILAEPPRDAVERVDVEREADFDGRLALAEMLRNYRGRAEESRDLYRQLDRDYPHRSDFPENR